MVSIGPFKLLLYPKPNLYFSKCSPINHLKRTVKVKSVDEKLRRYKSNCLRYLTKMNDSRMPEIMLYYRPNGRRRLGEPLKKLLDEVEQVYQGLTRDG